MRITDFVSLYLRHNLTKDMIVVDATMGNGHDTLFLSNRASFVYAFDIQPLALEKTRLLLQEENNYQLILDSHENILNHVTNFDAVIFNLGYLPGGDKNIATNSTSTLSAIQKLCLHMTKGFIIITVYPGHLAGREEVVALQHFLQSIKVTHNVFSISLLNKNNSPPITFIIEF